MTDIVQVPGGLTEFPVPSLSITFLGGPLDGYKLEPNTDEDGNETQNAWEVVFPDWVQPAGFEDRYYRMLPEEMPPWIVQPPHSDTFDQVYVWGPYYWTEAGHVVSGTHD